MAEALTNSAIQQIYLDPHVWIFAAYPVQRELYSSLTRILDKVADKPAALRAACSFHRLIDMVRVFYWDRAQGAHAVGTRPLIHPVTKQVIAVRPSPAEITKLRLLVLGLADEMIR